MNHISEQVQYMNAYFYSRKTYDIGMRIYYLKKLREHIIDRQEKITEALYKDFKKPVYETYLTEIHVTIAEIDYALKHIKKWVQGTRHKGVLPLLQSHFEVIPEPFGVCVIYVPFNYPFQLAMTPLIGALAAGNCVILKPSEHTPNTAALLKALITDVFPPHYVTIIEGDTEISSALLDEPIDYIFFTGGPEAAKKVMKKAAEHLIPVTLELGGKSPTIVDYDADLKLSARRIVWGKFINGGQTCIAPDYVLVHENIADAFLVEVKKAIKQFYHNKKDIAHIINESHYLRLLQLIDEDKIIVGGHFHTDSLYIEPTVLYPVRNSDACMQEEIFGPILPILPFKKLEEVVRFVQRKPKPLACYIFGENKNRINYLLKHISFGGGCINDTILHASSASIPFGGVGYSGMGAYHGYHSFKTFSHNKSLLYSGKQEIPLRYPPYQKKIPFIRSFIK